MSTATAPTFSGHTAADLAGITYRQLDWWARTDLIRPSARDAAGSGSRRRYSYADVLELKNDQATPRRRRTRDEEVDYVARMVLGLVEAVVAEVRPPAPNRRRRAVRERVGPSPVYHELERLLAEGAAGRAS